MKTVNKKRSKKQSYHVFIALGLILITFLMYWFLVIYFFPTWSERGLFGDSFGALNTFVSGIALIGIVYALYLQQLQLKEMRRSIELQQQPVVTINAEDFRIDRPSVFRSPDNPTCEALSRFHCDVSLSNVSEMPAINLVVNGCLFIPGYKGQEEVKSIGEHFPMLTSAAPVREKIMFVPEKEHTTLFQSLRKKDAFALPNVHIELVYRNLIGACFLVRQAYHVLASTDVEADLKSWHASISSFAASHQENLTAMENDKGSSNEIFNHIRESFLAGVGDKEYLSLDLVAIPGIFDARAITQDHYDMFIKTVGLPRLTFAHTTCPINDLSK